MVLLESVASLLESYLVLSYLYDKRNIFLNLWKSEKAPSSNKHLGKRLTNWIRAQHAYCNFYDQEIHESSRLDLSEKSSANYVALSDAEGNTLGQLNRGSIADLSLSRTLLAICQKSCEPRFWKVRDYFLT